MNTRPPGATGNRLNEEAAPSRGAAGKRRLWSIFATIVLLILLALLIDWHKMADEARRISLVALLSATAVLMLQPLMGSIRLWSMMRSAGAGRGFLTVARIYIVALLSNLVILNFVGAAVVRVFLMHRARVPVLTSSAILALEKIVILAMLLILGLLTAPMLPYVQFVLVERQMLMLGLMLLASTLIFVATIWVASVVLPWNRMRQATRATWHEIRALGLSGMGWAIVVLTTMTSLSALFAAYVIVADSLELPVAVVDLIAVLPVVTLVASLPISLGGWGLREATLAVMLFSHGIPLENAVLLGGLVAALSIVAALMTGLILGLSSASD